MTAYFRATGRSFSEAFIGTTHEPTNTDTFTHIVSDTVEDLEDRVNTALVALTNLQVTQYLAAASLAGSGDGHNFCVALVGNADTTHGGVYAGPTTVNAAGTRAFFYKAESEAELAVQCAACWARILAWVGAGRTPTYVDWQLAGAAKGRVHMGMILVSRGAPVG